MQLAAFYPILDVTGYTVEEQSLPERAEALACSGCTLIQLRAKQLASGRFMTLAKAIAERLRTTPCSLIINDRVDIALAVTQSTGTEVGVHIGRDDLPPAVARALLGPRAKLGWSTHSVEQAASADPRWVDYIGFGPVFDSLTKVGVRTARGTGDLGRACKAARVPVVAIGGISIAKASEVFAAGASSVAVIQELRTTDDVPALVARYRALRDSRLKDPNNHDAPDSS